MVRGEFFMGRSIINIATEIDPTVKDLFTYNCKEKSRLTVVLI